MDDPMMQQPQTDLDSGGQEEPNESGTSGFTIDPGQIEQGIKEQMKPDQVKNLDRVLTEGNKLLFGKDTHYQLMDGIKDSQDIPGDLGNGAFALLMMLYKGGGYTMPPELMLPTGAILLARACDFISKSGMAPVTEDDYEEAMHIFTTKLYSTLDPKFKERMDQSLGQPQQPQTGGILDQGAQP